MPFFLLLLSRRSVCVVCCVQPRTYIYSPVQTFQPKSARAGRWVGGGPRPACMFNGQVALQVVARTAYATQDGMS